MIIQRLLLRHFRNYKEQELHFSTGTNVFIGENAQGKTNALEAIYFLAMGKSHRTTRDADCIMWEQDEAQINASVVVRNAAKQMTVELKPGGKKAKINGLHQSKMTDFVGHFQVVLFAPEDLQLVKGSPGGRRRFIDMELGQTQPKYLYHLSHYQRTLQQRNVLLKKGDVDWDYLSAFDEQLVEHGAEVLARRLRFLESLKSLSAQVYETISNGRETFDFQYISSVPELKDAAQPTAQAIMPWLRSQLENKRRVDALAGHTTLGPHRDDLAFLLNGQNVQSFASQGQQRTIALSLRLAEIDFIYREIGEYPVLLLDDVLSELDDVRQRNLVLSMSEKVQTLITTTSLFQLENKLNKDARLFQVHSGIIQE